MATTTNMTHGEQAQSARAIKPAMLFRADAPAATFRQRFTHAEANLEFLDCGEYDLPPGSRSSTVSVPGRECLLFMWKGSSEVELNGHSYELANYDTLYVPSGGAFRFRNASEVPARAIPTSAPAQNVHPAFHSRFAAGSGRDDRIRHLK